MDIRVLTNDQEYLIKNRHLTSLVELSEAENFGPCSIFIRAYSQLLINYLSENALQKFMFIN